MGIGFWPAMKNVTMENLTKTDAVLGCQVVFSVTQPPVDFCVFERPFANLSSLDDPRFTLGVKAVPKGQLSADRCSRFLSFKSDSSLRHWTYETKLQAEPKSLSQMSHTPNSGLPTLYVLNSTIFRSKKFGSR